MTTLELSQWPACPPQLHNGVLLISTPVPADGSRELARQLIRAAIRGALAQALGISASHIVIRCTPGHAPQVRLPGFIDAGLSISHERGMSVAAIHLYGKVGIDLMRIQELPDWHPVARDYLGPQIAESLLATAAHQRAEQFAQHWCEREATLKCHGMALREWAAGETSECPLFALSLPASMVGALALLPAGP